MWVIVLPSLGCRDDLASSAGEELAAIVVLEPQLGFLGSLPLMWKHIYSLSSLGCLLSVRTPGHTEGSSGKVERNSLRCLAHMRQWKFITIYAHHPSSSHINGPLVWAEDPEHGVSALDDVSMFLAVTIQRLPRGFVWASLRFFCCLAV